MSEVKLKPCPFCGGKAEIENIYWVNCLECGAEADSEELWNTRPAASLGKFEKKFIHGHHNDYKKALDVKWLCPGCHYKVHHSQSNNL